MVTNLVEFPLEGGGTVIVATAHPTTDASVPYGSAIRGKSTDALIGKATESFDSVVRKVQPAAMAVLDAVRAGNQPPDEVTVEFGLEMTADLGAIIASTSVEANFTVTLAWRRSGSDAVKA